MITIFRSKFLNEDSAYAYAVRMQKRGDLITLAAKKCISKAYFEQLSRKCIDYEPPKKI